MNSLVALPIAAALPVAAPAMPSTTDRRALEAYASWLFMERRILCGELWPHMGAEAERYDWHDNAGAGWHFNRGDLAWNEGPQPSSRAAAVLDLAGVDWRRPKEDLGLNRADTGDRPKLPAGWPHRAAAHGLRHPDADLFAAIERYYLACREWEFRLTAFSNVELAEPQPRDWKSKQSASVKAAFAARNAEQIVIAIPATTIDGLIAKARAGKTDWYESAGLLISVGEDLIGMKPSREMIPPAKKPAAEDEKLIALAEKFEPLLDEYYKAHKIWSNGGKDPGANWTKLSALSKAIKKLPASSAAGLRAHALVAFWEVSPLGKGDMTYSFDDAYPFQMLFSAVTDFCGLRGKVEATGYQLPVDGDDEA